MFKILLYSSTLFIVFNTKLHIKNTKKSLLMLVGLKNTFVNKQKRSDIMDASDQKNKKIEPHVILHLKITQDDINRYLQNKIQTETMNTTNTEDTKDKTVKKTNTPLSYESGNLDIFTNPTSMTDPSPSNLDDEQFETLSVTDSEFNELKKNDVFLQYGNPIRISLSTPPDNNTPIFESTPEKQYFLSVPHINLDETPNIPSVGLTEDINCSDTKIKLVSALCEFADANRRKEWIKNTNIWCRWCVHPFLGPPVAIPKFYINKTFFVSGCYCSYNCAEKHLFYRGDINDTNKWNYYNLLHLLQKQILGINETIRIKLAPPQDTLKVFGGHLSIEDFRNATSVDSKYNKSYNIIEPPMVSIIPIIEETTYSNNTVDIRLLNTSNDMRSQSNMIYAAPKNESYISSNRWGKNKPFIPIDKDRMNRAIDNLKIKRKAPLLEKKKTLLHYMNLKINKNSKSDIPFQTDSV